MGPIEIPLDATIVQVLDCSSTDWALRHPHLAMQVHYDCQRSDCHTKSIAWAELVRTGAIVPDSNRSMRG